MGLVHAFVGVGLHPVRPRGVQDLGALAQQFRVDSVRMAAAAKSPHGDVTPEQVRAMLDTLKTRLDAKPDDLNGWVMLGRSHVALKEYAEGAAAFARASALLPREPALLADWGEALALSRLRAGLLNAGFRNVRFEYEPIGAARHYERGLERLETRQVFGKVIVTL